MPQFSSSLHCPPSVFIIFLHPFSARETTSVHLTTCIWSFLLNRKSSGGPTLWVTMASNTILKSTEKVFSTCSDSISIVSVATERIQYVMMSYCPIQHFSIPVSSLCSPRSVSSFTSLPVKAEYRRLIALLPSSAQPCFRDTALALHQEKKWYWLWKQRAVSIYTRPAQPRNRAISFNLAFEATRAALSMGTVVLSQAVDLFPQKCQEVF